jgi:murein DD-endopeptidase MepM/ murein hydrolase activator NlpD
MHSWVLVRMAATFLICLALGGLSSTAHAQEQIIAVQDFQEPAVPITLGDTWLALAKRFGTSAQALAAHNGAVNLQRQPAVGTSIVLPAINEAERYGRLLRPFAGGTLELALLNNRSPWAIVQQNDLRHPYLPLFYTPIFLSDGSSPPRELPAGLEAFDLAPGLFTPGSALVLHGASAAASKPQISLEEVPFVISQQGKTFFALGGTGAFFPPGEHVLAIQIGDQPSWEQPLVIADRDWTWEQVNYSNTAVLDPETIRQERERLQAIWDEATPVALWQGSFTPPIEDFVEISSYYGARRSVNGGPYSHYHEGTDYSAYGGSPVVAPAAGKVRLAEELAIRGNAVILDHGLGLHSGYYHLSAIHVRPGQQIQAGDSLGEVGSTGRSTGNHLHWDLLIGRAWIDPLGWLEQDFDTWISKQQRKNNENLQNNDPAINNTENSLDSGW